MKEVETSAVLARRPDLVKLSNANDHSDQENESHMPVTVKRNVCFPQFTPFAADTTDFACRLLCAGLRNSKEVACQGWSVRLLRFPLAVPPLQE